MRLVLLVCLLFAPAACAQELYFVGTGEDYVVFTEPRAGIPPYESSNFAIADAHGDAHTTYETHPGNDVNENALIPTFIYSGEPITLKASDVITAYHYASMNLGGGTGVTCGLTAHLYNAAGDILTEQHVASTQTATTVQEFVFTLTGVEGTFDVLKFQFVQTGAGTGGSDICGNAGIVHEWGSDAAAGRAIFPAPAAPAVAWQTLYADLDEPKVAHVFANATSDSYVLNFTTDLVNSTANFAWNATAGSVNATLTDANGTVVFDGTLEGNGTLAHAITNATAGAWNLTLAYTGFNGTLAFDLLAPDTVVDPNGGSDDTGSGPAPSDDANGNATLEDGPKETPVPWAVPVLGLLVAIVARRRS